MTDEEKEVLCDKNDLCKHLNDLGYDDFETYRSNEHYLLDKNVTLKYLSSLPSKILKDDTSELTPIDSYNYDKIMSLLRSKLLFAEDVRFVESVLSFCYICDEKKIKYIFGAVATSFISIAAFFNKGIDSFLPFSCVAMSSIYAVWKLFKDKSELNTKKLVNVYVKSLQSLCVDFHKVLRFLKEAEILSTGQVSTQNVGSAMYIPVNSVNGLNELPPWKTLPDLRKTVADSLIDVIKIFSSGCDCMSKFSPSWMDIKGFISNSQIYLDPLHVAVEDIKSHGGCISIKELQTLNDIYLLAQSEFLKWVAFYLCPAVWKGSKDEFARFKSEILMKYLENTQNKICNIAVCIKSSIDLQKVYTCPAMSKDSKEKRHLDSDRIPSNVDFKELKALQVELHQIFLLMLSTVQKAKILEDCLDIMYSKITDEKCVPIDDLKENLSHQLSIVRNDLAKVVKDYDYIYCQILSKNKSPIDHEDRSDRTELMAAYQPQSDNPERVKVGYSDFGISSPDEVFLALSGSKPEDFENYPNDWCTETKPTIPLTLLTELSTTLKPIKKVFDERERLVLKNLGIQDIENSEIDNKETEKLLLNHNYPLNILSGSTMQCFSHRSSLDETQSEAHTGNSLLMANLMKISLPAKQRSNLEEECFSND